MIKLDVLKQEKATVHPLIGRRAMCAARYLPAAN
jgi:hypothetical protein